VRSPFRIFVTNASHIYLPIQIAGIPMSESEMPWYVSLLLSWLPFLMFVLSGFYIARQFRRGLHTKDGRSIADVVAELSDELKRRKDN